MFSKANKKAGAVIYIILAIIIFFVGIFFGQMLLCKYLGLMC